MPHKPLLVLVDGSSYLYRAFHAMPALSTSRGEPTGAVYGVVNMLRRILTDAPDYLAVVFDAKGKTFREDIYADYKANRPSMPEALQQQIEPLHALVAALGVPIINVPGVEADDVIGTLASQARAAGLSVLISSGDKDFTQLVGDDVILANTMDGNHLDPKGVEDKFGVPPSLIVDYLALVGDAVDNVPGVPKVGPKTAVNWLRAHGSLDGVIANADSIKGKVGENLRATLPQLGISRELVTIKCDVPLERTPLDLTCQEPDTERLKSLYTQLEFKSWLSALLEMVEMAAGEGGSPSSTDADKTAARGAEIILDQERFDLWLERLRQAPLFSFDTETTGLDVLSAEIVGVSFAVACPAESDALNGVGATGLEQSEPPVEQAAGGIRSIEAAYVPVGHDYPGAPNQLLRDSVLIALRPLLEDPDRVKVGQNLKYDMQILARYGIRMAGTLFDTMLESYILDSVASRHDMDTLALKYLGRKTTTFEAVAGKKSTAKGAKQLTFNQVPLESAGPYAAEDAEVTLALHDNLWPRVRETGRLTSVFETIEMPLVPVLADMERHGVKIDAALLAGQSEELARGIIEIEREAHELAGEPFNLASPKQIQA
ncbi:MAG: DNA polymerase I, partial [Gammaproteobacteria bacterium]|nr:DNA polymerase I [Gammaproteobacteria bacterium]NNJ84901.1 DNA polymerase I [Gammaproteobacteria bacterium]